jgi:hypothetical protein
MEWHTSPASQQYSDANSHSYGGFRASNDDVWQQQQQQQQHFQHTVEQGSHHYHDHYKQQQQHQMQHELLSSGASHQPYWQSQLQHYQQPQQQQYGHQHWQPEEPVIQHQDQQRQQLQHWQQPPSHTLQKWGDLKQYQARFCPGSQNCSASEQRFELSPLLPLPDEMPLPAAGVFPVAGAPRRMLKIESPQTIPTEVMVDDKNERGKAEGFISGAQQPSSQAANPGQADIDTNSTALAACVAHENSGEPCSTISGSISTMPLDSIDVIFTSPVLSTRRLLA